MHHETKKRKNDERGGGHITEKHRLLRDLEPKLMANLSHKFGVKANYRPRTNYYQRISSFVFVQGMYYF